MRSATTATTEGKTFEAVRTAIDELAALVGYIVNNLNGNHVVVTADHGFLFTETPPGRAGEEQAGREARRHGPGQEALPDRPQPARPRGGLARQDERDGRGRGRHGVLDSQGRPTASTSRAAPGSSTAGRCSQEIVVPVVTVRQVEGKSAQETKTKPVTVHVLGSNHKITTHRHRFELIQMEPVSERVKPITLKVAVYEGDEPVTNVETVTFDSASGNMDERKKWVHPGPAGPPVRQEDALPPRAAGRRNRHRAAERGGR